MGIIAGTYGANSFLQQRSKMLLDQKATSASLSTQQRQLEQDKKDIEKYQNLNNIAKSIVPQDKDQAKAILEIVSIARQSNISRLSSVTFPVSTLGGVGATGSTSNLTQLTPVPGIPGVYKLQITVMLNDTSAVPYNTFINFLQRLEQNRRTSQVGNISVIPNVKNPNLVAFTLIIDEYIKP